MKKERYRRKKSERWESLLPFAERGFRIYPRNGWGGGVVQRTQTIPRSEDRVREKSGGERREAEGSVHHPLINSQKEEGGSS